MADKEDEKLVIVEDPPAGEQAPPPEEKDEDLDEEGGEDGDVRAGHTEGQDEGEDPERASRRQERQERKRRQREARERTERELNFLRKRNEALERQFSELEARQRKGEAGAIQAQLASLESQIAEAREIEAAAIAANEGEDAVEAREIREALERRREGLAARRQELAKPTTRQSSAVIPPEAQLAIAWIERNQWYDPSGSDENSAIAQAIESSLLRSGFKPTSEDYWEELDKRLKKRIPEVFKTSKKSQVVEDDDEEEEEEAPPPRKTNGNGSDTPAKRKPSGPVVTIGGQKRVLKANEVYISPERRQAMIEAGVWDDPVLRERQLAKYRQWDQENGNS